MPKYTWIIAGVLSALVICGFVGITAWQQSQELEKQNQELAKTREHLRQAQASIETNLAQAAVLQRQILADKSQIQRLQKEKEAAAAAQKNLEQEMRAALQSKDITISELQGRLTVNMLDRILFDSGEAVIKAEGEQVLQKIAGVLAQYPNRQIHVVGHTDNVPIKAAARGKFASNWELSAARATAAVRFLCEKASVDPRRLGAVGYGEFHPIADNGTAEGRAQNRRIELVVLPEELAAATAAKPPAPPDQPPAKPEEKAN